jgi:hypothetical protein
MNSSHVMKHRQRERTKTTRARVLRICTLLSAPLSVYIAKIVVKMAFPNPVEPIEGLVTFFMAML